MLYSTGESFQPHPRDERNLRGHIEQQIVNTILAGSLAPGQRLVESTIAEQLGVSRAPVREALAALEREGVVTSIPRRGFLVADFTRKDIDEIYSLRLLLELEAVRRAIQRVTMAEIVTMSQIVERLGTAIDNPDGPEDPIALDFAFHERICLMADHSRLFAVWNSMRMQTWLLIGFTSRTHYGFPEQSRLSHEQIWRAMLAKDLPMATALLAEHILDAQRRAMRVLQSL